jgi:hypothetical protein
VVLYTLSHDLTFGLGPVDVQREAMIAAARWMVAV